MHFATPSDGEFSGQEIKTLRIYNHRDKDYNYIGKESWFVHSIEKRFLRKNYHEYWIVFADTIEEATDLFHNGGTYTYGYKLKDIVPCTHRYDEHYFDAMFAEMECAAAVHNGDWDKVMEFDEETFNNAIWNGPIA